MDRLKPLDKSVMKEHSGRANLIPVIAKADLMTPVDLLEFKERIRACLEFHGIQTFHPPADSQDEDSNNRTKSLMVILSCDKKVCDAFFDCV